MSLTVKNVFSSAPYLFLQYRLNAFASLKLWMKNKVTYKTARMMTQDQQALTSLLVLPYLLILSSTKTKQKGKHLCFLKNSWLLQKQKTTFNFYSISTVLSRPKLFFFYIFFFPPIHLVFEVIKCIELGKVKLLPETDKLVRHAFTHLVPKHNDNFTTGDYCIF